METQPSNTWESSELHQGPHHSKGKKIWALGNPDWGSKLLVLSLVVAGIAVLTAMIVGLIARTHGAVKGSQYQAVFLTNGQVYFGNLHDINDHYVSLTNVYYLQQAGQVQQNQTQSQPTNLSLVKLGNELHGPENQMYIASDQILFWENLKDSGKVVQAIKNGSTTNTTTPNTNSTTNSTSQ